MVADDGWPTKGCSAFASVCHHPAQCEPLPPPPPPAGVHSPKHIILVRRLLHILKYTRHSPLLRSSEASWAAVPGVPSRVILRW
jgi:hypothetical protein